MSTATALEERVGSAEVIADAAERAYRPGFLRRRPALAWAIFVAGPLPALCLVWLSLLAGCAYLVECLFGGPDRAWFVEHVSAFAVRAFVVGLGVVSVALVAQLFAWLARRKGGRPRLVVGSALAMALFTGLIVQNVTLSEVPGQSEIGIGIGLGYYSVWQVVQFTLCLAAALLAAARFATRQPRPA